MTLNADQIRYIVIHCSATRPSQNTTMEDVDAMHRARGWSGCGYHFVIERSGAVRGGRPLMEMGAHAYGYNRVSWGICLAGGISEDGEPEKNFTPEQMASLTTLVRGLANAAPAAEVLGHRDLSPDVDGDGVVEPHEWLKQCPCFDVRAWMAEQQHALA